MSVNLGSAYAEIKLNTEGFSSGINSAKRDLTSFQSQAQTSAAALDRTGTTLTAIGGTMTKAVTVPLIGLGTAAVKTTATFDASMSKVQALSGATGKEFDALRNKALEMGSSTAFTASEAADALSYMGLAGWDTQQMLEGLPGVLNLAAASQMDLAEASDMVTDYLTAFGLEAKDAENMANQMAFAQSHSNTTTQQLGDAFGNCAAQMHTAGQTMETTTAFLEAMANQGTKGSEAGTALAAVMRDITSKMKDGKIAIGETSVEVMDQEGNFRSLIDIMRDVEKATDGMGSAEKSAALMQTFTARSIKAVSMSLTEGTDNIASYEASLHGLDDVAGDMADTMLNNLNGQLTILKSTLEGLSIQLGDIMMPYIKEFVEKVQELVTWFTQLDEEQKEQIVKWAAIVAAIGPALMIFGKLLTSTAGIIKAFSTISGAASGLSTILGGLTGASGGLAASLGAVAGVLGPILAVVAAVAGLGIALKKLYDQGGQFTAAVDELRTSLGNDLTNMINNVKQAIENFQSMIAPVLDTFKKNFDFEAVDSSMAKLVTAFGDLKEAVEPIISALLHFAVDVLGAALLPMFSGVMGIINGLIASLSPLIDTITDVINIFTDLYNAFNWFVEGLKTGDFSMFKETLKALGDDIHSFFTDLFTTMKTFISGFFEGFFTTFDSFTGGFITKVVEFFSNLWNNIVTFFTVTIPTAFNTFVNETVPNFIDGIQQWFDELPYRIGYAIGYALESIKQWGIDMYNWAVTQIPIVINTIIDWFMKLPGRIWVFLSSTVTKIITWGTDMKAKATDIGRSFVNNVINFIKTLPDKVWSFIQQLPGKVLQITDRMRQAGSDIFNALWNGMKAVWNSIVGWFQGVIDKVASFVQGIKDGMASANAASAGSHADGLAYVPYNGYVATLHEGERVLTRNEAEAYNSGETSGATFIFNSPKALDPYESSRLFKETVRRMEAGFA